MGVVGVRSLVIGARGKQTFSDYSSGPDMIAKEAARQGK